jgi:hypothetical protein
LVTKEDKTQSSPNPTTRPVRCKEKGKSENEALTIISAGAEGSLIQSFDGWCEHGSQVRAAIGWRPTWQLEFCQRRMIIRA